MQSLRHVLWIGGAPGSGKTTIARRIARRHGLRWYGADAHTWEHRDRAVREGHAAALRWEAMTPEERLVKVTPAEMFEMSLHWERGPMIVDDLHRLPTSPLIVAEGSTVPPDVVTSGLADRSRAVWLIPTSEFQRARLDERDIPRVARRNRDELYRLVAAAIEQRAREHGVPVLTVDGSRGLAEMVAAVEDAFAEALAEGPSARSAAERRALVRYANAAVASQYLGYLRRVPTAGDPASFAVPFACECGDPECVAVVEVAVGAFATDAKAPLLADGHD